MATTDLTTTPAEIVDLALYALSREGNNPARAEKTLKAAGHQITKAQLEQWRATHPDRYAEIRKATEHETGPRNAQLADDIVRDALETMSIAVRETRYKLDAGSLRDPSTAAKNLASTADLAAKQAALIRGQPTQITQDRSAEEILRALERAAGIPATTRRADAETTAEED